MKDSPKRGERVRITLEGVWEGDDSWLSELGAIHFAFTLSGKTSWSWEKLAPEEPTKGSVALVGPNAYQRLLDGGFGSRSWRGPAGWHTWEELLATGKDIKVLHTPKES